MASFTVYVPNDDYQFGVAPGSAIVSREDLDEAVARVTVYLEGDIYNRGMAFEEKLFHAADRCNQRYPTVAVRSVQRDWIRSVGTYDLSTRQLIVHDQAALTAWQDSVSGVAGRRPHHAT